MEKELTITGETKSGITLLHLSGDITKTSGEALLRWQKWEEGLEDGNHALLINFTNVSYINSAGIASLIRLVRLGTRGRYRTACYGLHYHYEKLFKMVGLTTCMEIFPSEWAAIDEMMGKSAE